MKRLLVVCVAVALATASPAPAQTAVRGGPFVPSRGGPAPYPGVYAPGFYGGPVLGTYGGPAGAAEFVAGYRAGSAIAPGGGTISIPVQTQVPQRIYHPQAIVYPPPRPTEPAVPTGPVPPPPADQEPPRSLSSAQPQPGVVPDGPTSRPPTGVARFTVIVPTDAKVWVNDAETKQTGERRRFHTPANLEAGQSYEYTFRVQWGDAGQTVTRDRTVQFKSGDDVAVDFTQAAGR